MGRFLCLLFVPFFFCFLFGRRPKERSFPACDRGRHIPAPGREGRRVNIGAPTQEPVISGIPCCNCIVRVHRALFPHRCIYDSLASFFFDGSMAMLFSATLRKVYLVIQLPAYSVHTKLNTPPYSRALLESFSYVRRAFLSSPRSRGRECCVDEPRASGQHWPLHPASSSIHQLQQVSCADHLRIDGISWRLALCECEPTTSRKSR